MLWSAHANASDHRWKYYLFQAFLFFRFFYSYFSCRDVHSIHFCQWELFHGSHDKNGNRFIRNFRKYSKNQRNCMHVNNNVFRLFWLVSVCDSNVKRSTPNRYSPHLVEIFYYYLLLLLSFDPCKWYSHEVYSTEFISLLFLFFVLFFQIFIFR